MFDDSPYAHPAGSFGRPLPPFTQDLDGTPQASFTVPCSYLPYIRGALQQLWLQSTWDTNDPAVLLLAQERAQTLVASLVECDPSVLPFSCAYDFQVADTGWELLPTGPYGDSSPFVRGVYDAGAGWRNAPFNQIGNPSSFSGIYIRQNRALTRLTALTMSYDLRKGDFDDYGGGINGFLLRASGVNLASGVVASNTDPDGGLKTLTWTGDVMADEVWCFVQTEAEHGSVDQGAALIRAIIMSGFGLATC